MSKEMYYKVFCDFVLTFGMVEMSSYRIVKKCHCQN